MDYSEEGSPLFWAPSTFRRSSESSDVDDQSPPSPWSLPPTGSHWRISDDIPSILSDTPEDQSYVANGDTSAILHQNSRERHQVHTQISKSAAATRRRRLSLPSGPLTTKKAIHTSDFTSDEPSTSPQQLRPRAQSIKKDDLKHAALPWAARRFSTHDPSVDDDVTSYQAMSPGTLATVTDTRYRSHTRAPRNLRQKVTNTARRHMTTSPPMNRVVVFSKPRASSLSPPLPIDDFTDIPPVELILFEPTKSVTAEVQRPRHSEEPLTSSPLKITQAVLKQKNVYKEETYSAPPIPRATAPQPAMSPTDVEEPPGSPAEPAATGRVTYLQMWVFCVAAATTLSLPLGMVILSYVATPNRETRNLTSGPFGTTKGSGTAKTAVHTYQLPIPPTRPTMDPWEGVPASCQQITQISDDVHLVSPQRSPILPQSRRPNTFCLYNNSKFHRGGVHDFLPQNIPFSHCHTIVYWSFGIKDGVPTSRAENFDHVYGLGKLREIANNSNIPGVKILLSIGGYREDYAQLSLLARDSGALSRFVQHTIALLNYHVLDGVAIHWLEGEPTCKSSAIDDVKALQAVFIVFRRVFRLNNIHWQLAVIVQTGTRDTNAIIDSIVDVVDFVFMDTRDVWHKLTLDYAICSFWSQDVMSTFTNQHRYIGNEGKFCMVISIAPLLVEASSQINGNQPPQFLNISRSSRYGSAPGTGNAFDMCGSPAPCLIPSPSYMREPCVILRGSPTVDPLLLYVYNSASSLDTALPTGDRCVLLADLDLDNYAQQCGSRLGDYWFTRYVDAALYGTASRYLSPLKYC